LSKTALPKSQFVVNPLLISSGYLNIAYKYLSSFLPF
jgi:hypothetical protein